MKEFIFKEIVARVDKANDGGPFELTLHLKNGQTVVGPYKWGDAEKTYVVVQRSIRATYLEIDEIAAVEVVVKG